MLWEPIIRKCLSRTHSNSLVVGVYIVIHVSFSLPFLLGLCKPPSLWQHLMLFLQGKCIEYRTTEKLCNIYISGFLPQICNFTKQKKFEVILPLTGKLEFHSILLQMMTSFMNNQF